MRGEEEVKEFMKVQAAIALESVKKGQVVNLCISTKDGKYYAVPKKKKKTKK